MVRDLAHNQEIWWVRAPLPSPLSSHELRNYDKVSDMSIFEYLPELDHPVVA